MRKEGLLQLEPRYSLAMTESAPDVCLEDFDHSPFSQFFIDPHLLQAMTVPFFECFPTG
jgi:hypothetical protein